MNACVPRWDIESASKPRKALWVKLAPSLYESRCGRFRVQQVQVGPGAADVVFLAYVDTPLVGWTQVGGDQTSLSAAIHQCSQLIGQEVEQGIFKQPTAH